MKWMTYFAAAFLLAGLVGCGDTKTDSKKLSVTAPNTVELKAGETKKFKFSVSRTGFDDDVKLTIDGLPDGVTAEDKSPSVKKGDKEIEVSFKAADSAAAIEKKDATVRASGGGLNPDPAKFTVKVTK